jgi:hypothetical protein
MVCQKAVSVRSRACLISSSNEVLDSQHYIHVEQVGSSGSPLVPNKGSLAILPCPRPTTPLRQVPTTEKLSLVPPNQRAAQNTGVGSVFVNIGKAGMEGRYLRDRLERGRCDLVPTSHKYLPLAVSQKKFDLCAGLYPDGRISQPRHSTSTHTYIGHDSSACCVPRFYDPRRTACTFTKLRDCYLQSGTTTPLRPFTRRGHCPR